MGVEFTAGMAVVFVLMGAAAVSFATGWVPVEITALAVAVLLAVLSPWTAVTPTDAIAGFSSPATVTVLAMFILSEGVRRTGIVHRLGDRLLPFTRESEGRRLAATIGLGGPAAGLVNNTPLVAVLIPMVVRLAKRTRSSPSKLLIPLSFASMLGGTLTLIGTSANILAADLSLRLIGHPVSMFEFTAAGAVIFATGVGYLFTAGRRLIPERVHPEADFSDKYRMGAYLGRVRVPEGSTLVGRELRESQRAESFDLDVLQIVRGDRVYLGPTTDQTVEAGDLLTVRAAKATLERFSHRYALEAVDAIPPGDDAFVDEEHTLAEVTLAPGSALDGETLVTADFRNRFGGTVLAVRRGDELVRDRVEHQVLREGDSLLLLASRERLRAAVKEPDLVLTGTTPAEAERGDAEREGGEAGEVLRREKTPVAAGILLAVVGTAAAGLLPIYVAALGGVVLMVATGCLRTTEAYEAVNWNVVLLLAGIIPLGVAMDRTGAADFLARAVMARAEVLPAVGTLALFYLLTSLLTNVITGTASLVLMAPVAVEAAARIGADPFAFLLVVMFAANTAFLSPVGYQTNLMVFTPGGYRFADFWRVGAPLQLLLAVVTPTVVALLWGV